MSPLRRRKRRVSRARARREALIQREQQEYGRKQDDAPLEEPADAIEPGVETAEDVEAADPVVHAAEPDVEESDAAVDEPVEAPEEQAPREAPRTETRPRAPRKRREFQPPSRVAQRPARKRRRRRRVRVRRPDLGGLRSASASGARATASHTAPFLRRSIGRLGRMFAWLLAWPLRLAGLISGLLSALVRGSRALGARALGWAERHLTPERVLVGVIAAAAACLGYSQFVAYRGVEVGVPQYVGVSTIAPPPQQDRVHAGAAHLYVLLPLAVIAVVIAVVALVTRRWQLGRLVSVIGLIGIVISLAIDLPKGLDAGTAGQAFAGAKATLTKGFYAQLASSAVLVLCGWVLAINLRGPKPAKARRSRSRRRRPRPRRTPSVARGRA